jgi:hypothetical protein
MVPVDERQRESPVSHRRGGSLPNNPSSLLCQEPVVAHRPIRPSCSQSDPQEYFAEVDEDYILDRFNLTGLNSDVVQEYNRALDLITDSLGQLDHSSHLDVPADG